MGVFDKKYERCILTISGTVEIAGRVWMGGSARICVERGAILVLGRNFNNTAGLSLICAKYISIGDNALISWDTLLMDTDFHDTLCLDKSEISRGIGVIYIGNNVWIGTRAVILKNSVIPDGCIVGANTLINKKFKNMNCLLAGNPGMIKRSEITLYRKIE